VLYDELFMNAFVAKFDEWMMFTLLTVIDELYA